jgi:signal transduction histidine kinase
MDNIIIFYGLLFVTISNILLSVFILSKGLKRKTNVLFGLIALGVAVWSLAMLGFYFLKDYFFEERIWILLTHSSAAFIACMFFYFTLHFPLNLPVKRFFKFLIFFAASVVLFYTLFTKKIVGGVIGTEYEINIGYIFFSLYVVFYFLLGYLSLFIQFKRTKNLVQRAQIKYVFLGSILSSVTATTTDLIFPFFGIFQYTWLGPFFTLILVVALAIAILKHHLFDIKVITVELFSVALLLVLFVNILLSTTDTRLIVNIIIFGASVTFSFLLVRAVIKEIEIRKKLRGAFEELKKVDKAKSEFISMASHQLRTPLTSIKGYVSMLLEGDYGKIKGGQKKVLKNVFYSNERLIKIVNDLLNISRIELGKIEIQKKETKIKELVKSSYQEMAQEAKAKKLAFSFKGPDKTLPKLKVDPLKIRQVVLNLLDNAIRYTEKGKIEIGVKKEGSKILVWVKDTGAGLSKNEKKEIFQSFVRGKAGVNLFIEGSGLGLYVAKKYINLHGGKIWAESLGRGKGSTFWIELPIEEKT